MSAAAAGFAAWAVEALVASAILMALVLVVRPFARRAFGPRVAYMLWALPALRLLLPPLPAEWRDTAAATPISRAGETLVLVILPKATPAQAVVASDAPSLGTILLVGWAIVAAGFLLLHFTRHLRFCRTILRLGTTVEQVDGVRVVESPAAHGPMAFGVVRRWVAFPRDFAERFDEDERALALAHELGHHARGDLIANWIALVVLALHWFNPLAWRAFHAFRADQELANDARVLAGRSLYERHAYACAIVKAAHGNAVGAACHLHSVKDLKGRLKMLRFEASPRRIVSGAIVVGATTLTALALTASGSSAAERVRAKVADATGIALPAVTPIDAVAPVAAAQAAAPASPVEPVAPAAPARKISRVVIVKDGQSTIYEGADADAYIAANPASVPPAPPVPPSPMAPSVAPVPPSPPAAPRIVLRGGDFHVVADVPQVMSGNCGGGNGNAMVIHGKQGGRRTITICTDRIERQARHGAEMAANAMRIQQDAMRSAMEGLRQTRISIASNRAMPEEARREALRGIDESIAEVSRDAEDYD